MKTEREWRESGVSKMSDAQRRMLNAACGDLADQIIWHGQRLSKDDWRHFLCGNVLGWRMIRGFDRGEGAPGFIMLGGSSLDLSKDQATEAITMAFHIGDCPDEQGLKSSPVRWSEVICKARWITEDEPA